MKEEDNEKFPNVTHYTKVDVQPGGINIQNVEHLHQADVLKALGIELEIKKDGKAIEHKSIDGNESSVSEQEELCHFIHPSITDEAMRLQIHQEIKNLVKNNTIPNICSYLNTMAKEGKILQPVDPSSAMAELQRMGMHAGDAKGFSYKNFSKYYRK